ncbi:MAG: hypothetical protein JKX70_08655 [Phycisphaerales bacterium]|nr:hypothetical protein [Phycisphaerales bacterium]
MDYKCAIGVSLMCAAGLTGSLHAADTTVKADTSFGADQDVFAVETPSYRQLQISEDSGVIRVHPDQALASLRALQVPMWSQVIEVDDADWVRLEFSQVTLARSTQEVRESYLRITSLEDGYEQYLDADSLVEWGNTTAYFNGSAVLVELMMSPNVSSQYNRVVIDGAQVSDPVSERSICFSTDDRVLSNDPRDGRLMPIGCSGWLFGPHGSCFMTASHCSPSGGNVMQFNVPLSSNGGGYRNPPPSDQYVVDGASVQRSSSIFIGNDWGFYGTFDNSTTGLSPLDAQGVSHTLAGAMPPVDGRPIRITGYGVVSSPVPGAWNGAQKTHVGPLASINGNTVRYQTDTTGGNSGSVILDDSTNTAIGIHTNAGCGTGGGSNQGTGLFNSGLQIALANPIGICAPRDIQASLLFEPTHIDPSGGDVITLIIDNLHEHMVIGVPTMFVDSGSGFVSTAMSNAGEGVYEGTFGAIDCGSAVSYYVSIEDEEGTVVTVPEAGVSAPLITIALEDLTQVFHDNFETNMAWSNFAVGSATGDWFRTIPGEHNLGDPPVDADGSSRCYVTANNNGVDVDNGSVVLLSPFSNLAGLESAMLRMSVWMFGQEDDSMVISVTDDFGVSWVDLGTFVNTNGWVDLEYALADSIDMTFGFRARITVEDGGADSTVEGGVDAFRIANEVCSDECPADLTGDGVLNFFDISEFLSAFSAQDPIADFTDDGVFNFFDVAEFLSAFSNGCP